MKKPSLLIISSAAIVLSLACVALLGGSDESPLSIPQYTPTIAFLSSPSPDPSLAPTPVPIPDFEESIILHGYGGGGGFCHFDLPTAPSVIGGTTYFIERASEPVPLGEYLFPRGAELCITGVPKDQPIAIKLISPDQKVTLNAEIRVISNPLYDFAYYVFWTGYPESWSTGNGEHTLQIGSYSDNPDNPIEVDLSLWWAGALPKGIWQIEVSWLGHTIYGKFDANTRNLTEVSLYDSRFESQIFPAIDVNVPYTCHMVEKVNSYTILVENAPANSLLNILVYSLPSDPSMMGTEAKLYYQTSMYTDENGNATGGLSSIFIPGDIYYILGVPEGVSVVTWNDGFVENAFSFATIANAMDCFVIP